MITTTTATSVSAQAGAPHAQSTMPSQVARPTPTTMIAARLHRAIAMPEGIAGRVSETEDARRCRISGPSQQRGRGTEPVGIRRRPPCHDAAGAARLGAGEAVEKRAHDIEREGLDELRDIRAPEEALDAGEVVDGERADLTLQQDDRGEAPLEDRRRPECRREAVISSCPRSRWRRSASRTVPRIAPTDAPYTRSPPTDASPSDQVRHSDASARSVRSMKDSADSTRPSSRCGGCWRVGAHQSRSCWHQMRLSSRLCAY